MAPSRIARVQERRERQRLFYSTVGIIAVIVFLALFGLKILVGFSLLVDRIRGGSPPPAQTQTVLIPPTLNPLPTSTNSEDVTVTGSGQSALTLVLFLNDKEFKKLTIEEGGTFSIPVKLTKGANIISSKVVDDKGNTSELSNIISITLKKDAPLLEISEPTDGATIHSDSNKVNVVGKTDEGNSVTINGRFVIVASDGSFRSPVSLNEGENILTIVAADNAGNQTVVDRKVTYQK